MTSRVTMGPSRDK